MTVLYNRQVFLPVAFRCVSDVGISGKGNVLRSELELKAEAKVDVLQTPGIVEPAWHVARAPSNIPRPGGSVQYDYGGDPYSDEHHVEQN
jgi:hypothetical protein